MEVVGLKAESHPGGNRVDLTWTNPVDANFRGVKILRREASYPELRRDLGSVNEIHDEPSVLTPAGAPGSFSDNGLKSETVYYYAVVAYDNTLPTAKTFPSFTSAMATGNYQSAGIMYRNLPAIYQRFDVLKPPAAVLDPEDKDKGQLLRLLEVTGPQFDLLRSFARAGRNFSDVKSIDGDLLPLLADWIGWDMGVNFSLARQRNEIGYAPHFYRTTGVAANLQAMINRITPWKAELKEFVHNVFLSNEPEQLAIWEIERVGSPQSTPRQVTLDLAYEGKPATVSAADRRQWIFYQTRQSFPTPEGNEDRWQIFYKIHDGDQWLPSRQVTRGNQINKYPAAVQRPDGSFWLFWTSYESIGTGVPRPQIKLAILSAGSDVRRPKITAALPGPFNFVDGDLFRLTVTINGVSTTRAIILHQEHFQNIAAATASELKTLFNRELINANARLTDQGNLVIEGSATGAASTLTVPASPVATKIGLAAGTRAGANATSAQLSASRVGPYALSEGVTLSIQIDADEPTQFEIRTGTDFPNLAAVSAAQLAAFINRSRPGVAQNAGGRLVLNSPLPGESSSVRVWVNDSTAAGALGFGAPLPPAAPNAIDDCEPTAFQDGGNNVWVFWSSRRAGPWNIWYNRFDGTSWGTAKRLTDGTEADREPATVFDPAGRIWVFWSRKKTNGFWNVFHRTTTVLNFATIVDADWSVARQLTPVPTDFDNKEPAACVTAANAVDLYYASNVSNGWHIRSAGITVAAQAADQPITLGQFSNRCPAVLRTNGITRLWFRSNESVNYVSGIYPSARTVDARYAGSTTADTDNALKIGAREKFADVQRYTYDTGLAEDDWYARNVLGIFLSANTNDQRLIERISLILGAGLIRFLPIQVRVVLVVRSLAGFLFLRTWKAGLVTGVMPDLKVAPNLSFRLFQAGATEGG